MGHQVDGVQGAGAVKRVVAAGNKGHGFGGKAAFADKVTLGPGGAATDDKIHPSGQQLLREDIRGGDDDFGGDLRQGQAGGTQGRQNHVQRRAGDRADADMAGGAGADFGQIAGGIAQFHLHALGAAGQGHAHIGQRHAAAGAQVDGLAGDPLYLGQKARGGGLGDADLICGKADLPGFQEAGHQSQMRKFQPTGLQWVRTERCHIISGMSCD